MKKMTLAIFALLAAISFSAFADGNYVGVDYGKVTMSNAGSLSNPTSVRIAAGYLTSGSEGSARGYTEFGFLSIGRSTSPGATGDLFIDQYSIQGAAVFAIPVASTGIDGLLRAGLSFNHCALTGTGIFSAVNTSDNRTGFIYGFGARYNINKAWVVDAQYESLGKFAAASSANGSDLSQVSIGLKYNY